MIVLQDSLFQRFTQEDMVEMVQDFRDYFSGYDSQWDKDYENGLCDGINDELVLLKGKLDLPDTFSELMKYMAGSITFTKLHRIFDLVQANKTNKEIK